MFQPVKPQAMMYATMMTVTTAAFFSRLESLNRPRAADAHHEYRRKRKCVAEGNDGRQDRADVNAPHDSCEAASQFYDRAVGDALDEAALVQRGGHDKAAHQRIRHLLVQQPNATSRGATPQT